MWVIRIIGGVGMVRIGNPRVPDGSFVVAFDADAHAGGGFVETSSKLDEARQFHDLQSAIDYYRQRSTVQPDRADGKPNRPLTAYSVEIASIEQVEKEQRG